MANDDDRLALGAARELARLLQRQLDQFEAETVTLTREQAIIALAVAEAAATRIERDLDGKPSGDS